MSKSKTFYITKYALTTGMYRADDCRVFEGKYATRGSLSDGNHFFVAIGVHAFETEDEAKKNVVKQIDAKLKSMEKQKKKLLELRNKFKD